MKKISHLLLIATAVVGLTSCSSQNASSDCFYEKVSTMAEIVEIRESDSDAGRMEVIMDFKASKLAFEDQELGELKDIRIDQDFVDRNRLKVGNQYSVIVSELTTGNCVPRIVSFEHDLE